MESQGLAVVAKAQCARLDIHEHIDRAELWIGEGQCNRHQIAAGREELWPNVDFGMAGCHGLRLVQQL